MNCLIDTHYLIWALTDTANIPASTAKVLTDPENRIFVSVISFWEISLKHSIGKLKIEGFSPEDLPELCTQLGFDILDLDAEVSSTYLLLQATHHRDPFDRMLIWTAIKRYLWLVTADKTIKQYSSIGLKVL